MACRRIVLCLGAAVLLLGAGTGESFAQQGKDAGTWQARFDVAAGIGWMNARPQDGNEQWFSNHWYNDALWYGVEGGYFFTENLKLELGAATASEGRFWTTATAPRGPLESYLSSEHAHRVRTFSAGVTYQFGRNAWVHPYIGGGVDIDRDRIRTRSWVQPAYDPRTGTYQPPYQLPDVVTTETVARPYGMGGVKVFFNQKVFFRADVKAAGRNDLDKVLARVLVGADF